MKTNFFLLLFLIFSSNFGFAQNRIDVGLSRNNDETGKIYWELDKEINTSYFLILKSVNNTNFEIVSKCEATGYSLAKTYYELDLLPNDFSAKMYKIVLVWMDGTRVEQIIETGNEISLGN